MSEEITVTLTTCGRLDLLEKTINSFLTTCNFSFSEFIIYNDNPEDHDNIISSYKDYEIKVISDTVRRGQTHALDTLFKACKTEYIFHLEEDWFFDSSNNYVKSSLDILKEFPDIHQVWVRHEWDNPHKPDDIPLFTTTGVEFSMVKNDFTNGCSYPPWVGFSWNPGLRRLSDYKKMFPSGYSKYTSEKSCNDRVAESNYRAALLKNTSCYHIGWGRHVE